MKKKFIIGILLIATIAAAVIFLLPMIQEQRAYNKVKSEQNVEACDSYEKDWPEGKHLDDVLYIRVQIAKDDGTCINEICRYLRLFPKGKYVKDVNDRWDEIWDKEIRKYEDNDKSQASADGIDMMRELLQYMKRQRINTLLATYKPSLNIKDFAEYDEEIQLLMERTNETTLPYKEGVYSIKSNYDSLSLQTLNDLLVEELQKRMDEVFSPGFIQVVAATKSNAPTEKMPSVTFDYQVNNTEMTVNDKAYPQIWSYPPKEDDEEAYTEGFLIGTNIDMKILFNIPESIQAFTYQENQTITDYLKEVKNVSDGYKEMTSLYFQNVIGIIGKMLGL